MKTKICIGCGRELPIDQFYRHPKMADGYIGKCKECTKKDVVANRLKKLDYYREYDRQRADLPERVKARKEYYKKMKDTTESAVKKSISRKKYKSNYPEKAKAHMEMSHGIRDHKVVKPEVCSVCGKKRKLEGHHYDYSKPLEVIWVCRKCHLQIHKKLREFERLNNN